LSGFTINSRTCINKIADIVRGIERRPIDFVPSFRRKNGDLTLESADGTTSKVFIESHNKDRPAYFEGGGVLRIPLVDGQALLAQWPGGPHPSRLRVALAQGVSATAG